MAPTRVCLVFGWIACLALPACGGGGGGGGDSPAAVPFSGTYRVGSLAGFEPIGPLPHVEATYGRVTTLAGGALEMAVVYNRNGHVTPGLVTSDDTFTLAADRTLTWSYPSAFDPVDWLRGGVSRGGGLAVLASILTGADPQMVLLVRPRGSYTVIGLAGSWHTVEWTYDPLNDRPAGGVGDVQINADSTWSSNVRTYTQAGSTDGGLLGTYGLAGDGTFDMLSGGSAWLGGVLEGGQVAVVCGAAAEDSNPSLRVLVRESPGTTNATLSGDYWLGVFERGAGGYQSGTGTAAADGVGGLVLRIEWNTQTNFTPGAMAQTATYGVNAVGNLALTLLNGTAYFGAVSGNGSFAVLGGGTNAGAPLGVWVLVRR